MSLRRLDVRFLLSRPIVSAAVLGGLESWMSGLRELGVAVHEDVPSTAPDLVVSPSSAADRAVAVGSPLLVLEGTPPVRTLRAAGLHSSRYLPLPELADPALLLPIDYPRAAIYGLRNLRAAHTPWKAVRDEIAAAAIACRSLPAVRPMVTIGSREPGASFLIAGLQGLGVPADGGAVLKTGGADALSRAILYTFAPGEKRPRFALKFARIPGYREPFDRDARGLELARTTRAAARRAPTLVGSFEIAGYFASLESAATGRSLMVALQGLGTRRAKLEAVARVAAWLGDVAAETRAPATRLERERDRLRREVVPRWTFHGARAELVDDLEQVGPVLTHNDLGSWNIVVDGRDFVAVDWESARPHGPPLWDLWYFLADALAHLDGAREPASRESHFVGLFRGELESSELLFRYTAQLAATSRVPRDALGSLATLCWMHHGLSFERREQRLAHHAPASEPFATIDRRRAELWLSAPGLGPRWVAASAVRSSSQAPDGDRHLLRRGRRRLRLVGDRDDVRRPSR